jgi:beta-glucanase (GH16 family)
MKKEKVSPAAIALITVVAAAFTFASCTKKAPAPKGYHLVWSDEFSAKKIDTTKWDFQTGTGSQYGLTDWGNNELEYYAPENAFIEKGNLVLEARKEDKEGKQYTSARLRTMKEDGTALFSKTYGRIEARIKLPKGNGIWPAFWLLPATNDYGVWASSGEIDILEAKGRLINRIYGTVHYGQAWPGNKYSGGMYKFPDGQDIGGYHTYALEWEPGKLTWLVDDTPFYETQQWWSMGKDASEPYPYPAPYDKPFYILLNLAVGGNFDSGVSPDSTSIPARMYVDYVRVYDKDEPYATAVTRPEPKRDSTSFKTFTTDENKSFIFDKDFTTCSNKPATKRGTEDIHARVWNFSALDEYGGKASSSLEKIDAKTFRHVTITNAGSQNYSVQLIQYFPVASGYSYRIQFDAKAKAPRTIAVKIGGDADNSWTVYSPEYNPNLTEKVQHYAYFFTMENDTDPTARLEFNLGLNTSDVWISNVTVTEAPL